MQCCMVSTCLSCYWQDLMDWCWHEPTTLLISTLAMSVTANIWDTSQNMLVALVPAMSLHVLLLWLKCAFSSLSVALGRWSEMVGDNLLSYFEVRWVCGSTWRVIRIKHRTHCLLIVWWHREARKGHMMVKTIFIASCQFLWRQGP